MSLEHRYRATLEYDGTDFHGFQVQVKKRTVQGELEKSIHQVAQHFARVVGAGRTDAGVHALGQVVTFRVAWKHHLNDLHQALNATLPEDIVVKDLCEIDDANFHPRFSAVSRTYHYHIINRSWPSVLQRRYTYHINRELDLAKMREAGELLVGTHDFASFGKPPQGNKTIRQVMQAEWLNPAEDRLIFSITANAFLYRMVRRIVGTLVKVGTGSISVDEIKDILEARDLKRSAAPAPASGLCLVKVTYPEGL